MSHPDKGVLHSYKKGGRYSLEEGKVKYVFIICAEQRGVGSTFIFPLVCGKLSPVDTPMPLARGVRWLGAGGRDLIFIESSFVPLEILNPGDALPI